MNASDAADELARRVNIVATDSLVWRPQRTPNLYAEVAAFRELSEVLGRDPHEAIGTVLRLAIRLCGAGSAGVSLLRPNAAGDIVFHWDSIVGELAELEGGEVPRDFSPCGLCLDSGASVLVQRPERVYEYFRGVGTTVVEGLLIPLFDTAKRPLGAMWITHHQVDATFCAEDARIVEQLGVHLVLALKLVDEQRKHRQALAMLESTEAEQRSAASDLREERGRRERAEVAETGVRRALSYKDAAVQEMHHRVKNTIQIAASFLSLQGRATGSLEVRTALGEAYRRLLLLAEVHELLYSSAESHSDIAMPKLLQLMGEALRQSFVESTHVVLRLDCEPMSLPSEDAVPIALLANEALTNAYKYAFPDNKRGSIDVSLRRDSEKALVLQIADNGIGLMPTGMATGLGLKLIRSFATQLRGELSFENRSDGQGTILTLTIDRSGQRSSASVDHADASLAIHEKSPIAASDRSMVAEFRDDTG